MTLLKLQFFLTKTERAELLRALKLERHRRYADRIRVILLLDDGESVLKIAKFLFLDAGPVRNYRKSYVRGGFEELILDGYQGSLSKLSLAERKKFIR